MCRYVATKKRTAFDIQELKEQHRKERLANAARLQALAENPDTSVTAAWQRRGRR